MYGPPGTGPEAPGGLRRSKIGVLGSQGVRGVSGVLFQACPMAPVDPFLGLDPHLYRADALVSK